MATKPCKLHDTFCVNVLERRQYLGLTQSNVADRMGITPAAYANIERGQSVPGLAIVERVAEALETKCTELLCEPARVA